MPSFIFKGLHRRSAFENCHLQFLPSSSAARRRSQLGLSKVFPGICGTRRIFLGDQWHPSIWGGVGVLADSIETKGRTIYCCVVVSNHPKKQPRPMLEIQMQYIYIYIPCLWNCVPVNSPAWRVLWMSLLQILVVVMLQL